MLKRIHHHLHRHYHKNYHGKYSHAKQLFIFDIFLLVLAVAIFISSVVFLLRKPTVKDDVEMVMTTNVQTLKSGTPVKLIFEFTNTSKVTLHPSTLAVRLPHGFIIDRTKTPETVLNKNNTIALSTPLAPGAKGRVEIEGVWWTDPRQPETLFATLSYHEDKNENLDQKLISFTPTIPTSVLETHLNIATSTFPNQTIPFEYSLTNNSDASITNLSVTPNWSGSITFSTSTSLQNISLGSRETKKITGSIIAPKDADNYPFEIRSHVRVQDRTLNQTSNKESMRVVYPAIVSEARLSEPLPYLEPGQEIPVEIHWQNNSTFTLSNQRLRVQFSPSGIIDLAATAQNNRVSVEGNGLIITSVHKTALTNGQPGSGDTFTLKLQTLPSFNLAGEHVKLEIVPSIDAEALLVKEQRFNREGNKLSIPVASTVALTRNEVRYYTPEGDQIGRGTLPPKVGETTKYMILLQVSNSINELKDAELAIQLAPGVTFNPSGQGVTLGPRLQYNAEANTVSWKYSNVPAQSKPEWNFMVEVTPTPEQIGKTLPLVNSGVFTATDVEVGKKFEIEIKGTDNVLPKNDKGSRMGTKVKR